MHQREQTTSPPSPPPGCPSPPHPAAVQLLQAPVDPLLHVQPPLQLSPVILDGDARVPLLQPPGAAPRPPGPRWSLQLAQHPLAQPLSCHRGPGPGPGAALCAFAGRPGDLLRAGAGPAGGGGSDSQGGRPRPDRPGPQFPRLQREDLPLRPREAHGCSWFRYGRGPGAPGPAEWLGLPGPGSPGRGGLQCRRPGFDPWVGKIPWRRKWQPTPVFLPGESPWTEEPDGLRSMGSQRVGHDWVTDTWVELGNKLKQGRPNSLHDRPVYRSLVS